MTPAGSPAVSRAVSPAIPRQVAATVSLPGQPSQYQLTRRQLDAIDRWHAARRVQQAAAQTGKRSREQRLDTSRRMDVLREQHRAIIERTHRQLRDSLLLLARSDRPRAVVVHRDAWFIDRVAAALAGHGVEVVGRLGNGAEAVGVAVVEQPDLLLVEESLPMLSGEAVVREVLALVPTSVVAAQVAHDDGVHAMLEAGARAAYVRRLPPAEVAASLVGLLPRQAM